MKVGHFSICNKQRNKLQERTLTLLLPQADLWRFSMRIPGNYFSLPLLQFVHHSLRHSLFLLPLSLSLSHFCLLYLSFPFCFLVFFVISLSLFLKQGIYCYVFIGHFLTVYSAFHSIFIYIIVRPRVYLSISVWVCVCVALCELEHGSVWIWMCKCVCVCLWVRPVFVCDCFSSPLP